MGENRQCMAVRCHGEVKYIMEITAKAKRSDYFSESMEFVIIHLLLHSSLLKDVTQTFVKAAVYGLQFFYLLTLD